jgi:hypothetical protein
MSNIVTGAMRAAFEKVVRVQIDRHLAIDPNTNPKRIVELTIRQMRERQEFKLQRLLDAEDLSEDDEFELLRLRSFIDDLLPELEILLKRRY